MNLSIDVVRAGLEYFSIDLRQKKRRMQQTLKKIQKTQASIFKHVKSTTFNANPVFQRDKTEVFTYLAKKKAEIEKNALVASAEKLSASFHDIVKQEATMINFEHASSSKYSAVINKYQREFGYKNYKASPTALKILRNGKPDLQGGRSELPAIVDRAKFYRNYSFSHPKLHQKSASLL